MTTGLVRRRAAARPVPDLGGDDARRLCPGRRGADDPLGLVRQPLWPGAGDGAPTGHLRHGLCRRNRARGGDGRIWQPLAQGAVSSKTRRRCAPWSTAAFGGERGEPTLAPDRRAVPDQGLGGAAGASPPAMSPPIPTSPGPSATRRRMRAVGTAVGRNPISLADPLPPGAAPDRAGLAAITGACRVKRAMLAWEAARDAMRDARKPDARFVTGRLPPAVPCAPSLL